MARTFGEDEVDAERDLIRKAQSGDLRARRKLHGMYQGLIGQLITVEFGNASSQSLEAIRLQASNLLDDAIDKVNIDAANKPSTYIRTTLQGKLKRYKADHDHSVRLQETNYYMTGPVMRANESLTKDLGRKPTSAEIAEHINIYEPSSKKVTSTEVKRTLDGIRFETFGSDKLGGGVDDDFSSRSDMLFKTQTDPLTSLSIQYQYKDMVDKVNQLSEPTKTIIKCTYGIDGAPKKSLRELSVILGITKYQVEKGIQDGRRELGLL